ncbi:hypothetical protein Taro_019519 [Colocasia esculenta]|uniref:Uncharacterized protein n=1 Tax=Colocasia esculenta TaxID=4460 RepID=A0A843UTZ7_COLES|nr:hypothetical protein [Colocasia esculenta]
MAMQVDFVTDQREEPAPNLNNNLTVDEEMIKIFTLRIWCVEHDRAPILGGGAVVGGVCLRHQVRVSLHLLILEYQVRVSLHLLLLEYQLLVLPLYLLL